MVATTAAPAVTIERLAATDVPAELEEHLLVLTLPTGDMARVYRACARGGPTWTGQVLVARTGDEVVGWALRWKLDSHWRRWHVHLFVHPDHRRRGSATTLVAACRHRFHRDTRLQGAVWDDNSAAFWAAQTEPHIHAPDHRR